MIKKFTHIERNKASMVDISKKTNTNRLAKASAKVKFSDSSYIKIKENGSSKGEILSTARIAGIQAGKKTSELIPLCHSITINFLSIDFKLDDKNNEIIINSTCKTNDKTGVEMEALVAVSTAALTIYDMCKAIDKSIQINDIKLNFKSGGKSKTYKNDIL
tara:strand:+ start:156 stop:638 length:483 start_codon:yes stop_codon:yes gene_type:complete